MFAGCQWWGKIITKSNSRLASRFAHIRCATREVNFENCRFAFEHRTPFYLLPRRRNIHFRGHEPGHSHVLPNLGKGSG